MHKSLNYRNPPIPQPRRGLTLLCLTLLLSSCASAPDALVVNKTTPARVPLSLTEPTPAPQVSGRSLTNSGLLALLIATLSALEQANADKTAIREWDERRTRNEARGAD